MPCAPGFWRWPCASRSLSAQPHPPRGQEYFITFLPGIELGFLRGAASTTIGLAQNRMQRLSRFLIPTICGRLDTGVIVGVLENLIELIQSEVGLFFNRGYFAQP